MIETIIGMFVLSIRANWCGELCHFFARLSYLCVFFLKVNPRFAIDLIRRDPVVVCEARGVWSDSGGPLGK